MITVTNAENPCENKDEIAAESVEVIGELILKSGIGKGDLLVIGCSTSEVVGSDIGHGSSLEAAKAIFDAIYPLLLEKGIALAVQCCEHLNRCIIIEKETAKKLNLEIVNVVPQPKAGGSFAFTAYKAFEDPVAVETVKADAGLDIGLTLIGMHLRHVAVPIRLQRKTIGKAAISAARTRPKFIGGERAAYDPNIL